MSSGGIEVGPSQNNIIAVSVRLPRRPPGIVASPDFSALPDNIQNEKHMDSKWESTSPFRQTMVGPFLFISPREYARKMAG